MTGVSTVQLLTKKDMNNIAHEFGINRDRMLHKNDADSVAGWIERTRQDATTANLVRFVKFQGDEASVAGLGQDDFMLVLATDAQLVCARQFCGPMKELCMDSTHGMNAYNFQLTTLLCIDEHGEGFPIAFCYSNHVDERSMRLFLEVVRDALGYSIEHPVLMTDDTEVYSNAWNSVMGQPAVRLLCTWHVDRAWRKNLPKIKGGSDLKAIIYKTIRTLMELTDKDVFAARLGEFLSAATDDEKTSEFAEYFRREYASRPQLWSYAYRIGLKVHHNMHLEAMHRVIKHVHLQGRKVRRLDTSIHALMRFVRTKLSDRLLKLHRGKWTRHVGTIRKRHTASMKLTAESCSCLETNMVFTVAGAHDELYTVRQSQSVPHDKPTCALTCLDCDICIHTFSCTCLDSGLRNTICKHIHLVVRTFKPDRYDNTAVHNIPSPHSSPAQHVEDDTCDLPIPQRHLESETDSTVVQSTEAILTHMAGQKHHRDTATHIAAAERAWASIRGAMQQDESLAPVAAEQLTKVSALMTALLNKPQESRLPELPSTVEPWNKKAPTQRFFASTKKAARPKNQLSLTKPTNQEKDFLLTALSGNAEVVSRQPPQEHDYSFAASTHVIEFEHSYSAQ